MRERVLFVDMAKGIAIIAIVMLHFSFQFDGESARLIALFNHSWDTRLFFVLSGMVASMGEVECVRDLFLFLKKKFLALFLPFVVWSTIITPYVINRSTINDYPTIFINEFVPPLGGYWFLLYLFFIQVMFGVVKYVSGQLERNVPNKLYRELLISAILIVPLFFMYKDVLFFLFGYFIFVYGRGILFNRNVQFWSFFLFVIFFELKRDSVELSFIGGVSLLIALTASVFIIGITYNIQMTGAIQGIIGRLLCFFGHNSLEIYLLHYVFIGVCAGNHISVSHVHAIPLYVLVLGVSICICFLCCGVGNVLKRIPYISMLLMGNRH